MYYLQLDKPSRFDRDTPGELLTGSAGTWFDESCIPRNELTVSLRPCPVPHKYKAVFIASLKPSLPHGYFFAGNQTHIWPPQDAMDVKDYEGLSNDDDKPSAQDNKDREVTKRANWKFWTEWICRKARTLKPSPPLPRIITYPPATSVISVLNKVTRNDEFYFDIESRADTLDCIGFSVNDGPVYVVPFYRYNNKLAYSPQDTAQLYRAFLRAMSTGVLIAHNSSYDLVFLGMYYRWLFGHRIYDTMAAQHRLFPQLEKSLAHAVMMWTNRPYHKGEMIFPHNPEQEAQLWAYNGKDVAVLKEIKAAQWHYAMMTDNSYLLSINQVNDSIEPYLVNSLFGLRVDLKQQALEVKNLEREKAQALRLCRALIGSPDFNPGSTAQCQQFFYNTLNYQPPAFSAETKQPMCDSKSLYKLLVKYGNPLIPFIIRYRAAAKELSNLTPTLYTPKWLKT
jgi:hypothetical protein